MGRNSSGETKIVKPVVHPGKGASKLESIDNHGHVLRRPATPVPLNSMLMDPRLHDCRRVYFQDIRREIGIGAYVWEVGRLQEVIINLDIFVAWRDSTSNNDDLNDVFDYDSIYRSVIQLLDSRHFALQETLIDAIVGLCLLDHRVRAVRAMIAKTSAYDDAAGVGIEVFRFATAVTPDA